MSKCTRTKNPDWLHHRDSSVKGYCFCGEKYPDVFNIGDEVTVRCRVVGPTVLPYGYQGVILDLVPLDDTNEISGSQFTVQISAITG